MYSCRVAVFADGLVLALDVLLCVAVFADALVLRLMYSCRVAVFADGPVTVAEGQ